MKQLIKSTTAIFLPWVIILLDDNPGGAILALILQASIIGWIPAAVWAWRVAHKGSTKRQHRKEEEA